MMRSYFSFLKSSTPLQHQWTELESDKPKSHRQGCGFRYSTTGTVSQKLSPQSPACGTAQSAVGPKGAG